MLKTRTKVSALGIPPTFSWVFPILAGLLLMQIFIFHASTAMFINSNKILENRDGNIPSSQIGVEQEQSALQITKAHEVLRVSLRDYLEDVNDANLTFYLEQMRAQKEPYRDEFNQILPSYTKVFFFISQAVDELMKNNYAIGHFEKDQQDVCNVARYLSNQYNFKDRKSVLKKMGDALGKDCDPCTPYKRKQYDKRDVSTRFVADPSQIILTDENALCRNFTFFTSTTERISATTENVLSSQEETKTGNRDEVIVDLPAEEKTLKTNQIARAHEVLRVALKDYLGLVEANTTFYLDEMRSQSEPFRDEYGQVIPFYKKVLTFITEQINEMVIGNYAVGQFAKDRHDLCSIARYLSHQTGYSERQTIIQRMGEALGSECDPCIPYRRKQYSKRDTALTNRLCPNVTSASEVDSSNRPFASIVYKQDDFAPCEYYPETNSVDCDRFLPIKKIYDSFKRLSASVPFVQLETFVLNTRYSEEIPEDLIGNSKIARIAIYCDHSTERDLRVNRNAFKSTEKYTKEILIQSCNLRRVNFSFLNNFDNLVELAIDGSYQHLEESISSLPILNSLKTLSITFPALTQFKASSFLERLQQLNKSNGTINLRRNRFDCSTSICDYAWIIRDHRDLLKNIVGATCDNEIPFDKLDPINDFKECL